MGDGIAGVVRGCLVIERLQVQVPVLSWRFPSAGNSPTALQDTKCTNFNRAREKPWAHTMEIGVHQIPSMCGPVLSRTNYECYIPDYLTLHEMKIMLWNDDCHSMTTPGAHTGVVCSANGL